MSTGVAPKRIANLLSLGMLIVGGSAQPVGAAQASVAGPSVTSGPSGVMRAQAMACSAPGTRDFSALPDVSLRIASAADDAGSYVPVLPATPTQDDIDWIGKSSIGP